jgi:hypothetical protein
MQATVYNAGHFNDKTRQQFVSLVSTIAFCYHSSMTTLIIRTLVLHAIASTLLYGVQSSSAAEPLAVASNVPPIERSLNWLRETQDADGSWSTVKDPKSVATSLALLTYLTYGVNPSRSEVFGESLERGLEHLISAQQTNGTFRETGKHPAIAHGIITLALCEAYSRTQHPSLQVAAEKALQVVLTAQRKTGLWDAQYRSKNGTDDLEASVWQVRAITSARMARLDMKVGAEALKAAADGASAVARSSDASSAPFVIYPLQRLDRMRDAACIAPLVAPKETQINWTKPQFDDPIAHWYFTGEVLFGYGGAMGHAWQRVSVPNLVDAQTVMKTSNGIECGYWDSPGNGEKYGRVYTTALCSLILMSWSGSQRSSCAPYEALLQNSGEFVYTVGTDSNGVPIQPVEWIFMKPNLNEGEKYPICPGTLVTVVREEDHAVCIQFDERALPAHRCGIEPFLNGNIVTGWLKKEAIIKVRRSEWMKLR